MAAGARGHPSQDIAGSHGAELSGKRIVLCVAGSVAAYRAIELSRLLMRHGADVRCVASSAVLKLIRADYFKWATGNDVVTKLTGKLEHIDLADYGRSDLIIVYPATANTLGKLANGIDDTPVSTVLTVGLGSKTPIVMCLAMHAAMYGNAAVRKNMRFLKDKIEFFLPQVMEGKAKAGEPGDVLDYVLKRFGYSSVLGGKSILITAGSTAEPIDPIRVITNQSTGETGVLLAKGMLSAGANVTLIYGLGAKEAPAGARHVHVRTAQEMLAAVKKEMKNRFDVVIMAAAVSDYTVRNPRRTKISSRGELRLTFARTPKIIDGIRGIQNDTLLVGFKAEAGVSRKELESRALKKMRDAKADMIVANDVGTARYRKNPHNNEVLIASRSGRHWSGWHRKEMIAGMIVREVERLYSARDVGSLALDGSIPRRQTRKTSSTAP